MKLVRIISLLLLLAPLLARSADAPDIAHYQIIAEKNPFGAMAAAGVAAETPNWCASYTFVGLVSDKDTNLPLAIIGDTPKNRTYFRAEGELLDKEDIVKVTKIEQSPTRVILQRQLESCTLAFTQTAPRPGMPIPGAPGAPPGMPTDGGPRRIPFRRVGQ